MGGRVEVLERRDGRASLQGVLELLAREKYLSLMIEAGSKVNWSVLESSFADKIFFYYAPKILAGSGAIPFATSTGYKSLSDAAYVHAIRLHRFGEDFAVEGYLRDPYQQ